jgi:hypothetical protein
MIIIPSTKLAYLVDKVAKTLASKNDQKWPKMRLSRLWNGGSSAKFVKKVQKCSRAFPGPY